MNTCVCCGEPIPEGRQVCPTCEDAYQIKRGDSVRIRKTDIAGTVIAVHPRRLLVNFQEYIIPIMCYEEEIEKIKIKEKENE